MVMAGFAGDGITRAVSPSVVWPRTLGSMVGMDQKDSFAVTPSGAALGLRCCCSRFGATTVQGQEVLKTVEVPQLQCLFKLVDVPVVQIFVVRDSSWTSMLTCPLCSDGWIFQCRVHRHTAVGVMSTGTWPPQLGAL